MEVEFSPELQRGWSEGQSRGVQSGAQNRVSDCVEWIMGNGLATGSVLCVGCQYGYEVEAFLNLGHEVLAAEPVPKFFDFCTAKGLDVKKCVAEELSAEFGKGSANIYSSHSLEHFFDQPRAIKEMKIVAKDWIFVAVPIERGEVRDRAHLAPFRIVPQFHLALADDDWMIINSHESKQNQRGVSEARVLLRRME